MKHFRVTHKATTSTVLVKKVTDIPASVIIASKPSQTPRQETHVEDASSQLVVENVRKRKKQDV